MLLLTCYGAWARTITVVSYNVQNLFDDTDDGGEYRQFTRAGGWTSDLYTAKLRAIGSALRAAARDGADLVALQEVEHYGATRRLVDQELDGLGYRHVVWLPDPHNATGPVVLSKLPVRRVGALWVDSSSPVDGPADGLKGGLDRPLRPILEVEVALGATADAPSLFLFNNHWKSKRGGAAETEGYRRRAAALLAARLDEIIAAEPAAEILVVGDLNEAIDEYARQGRRYVTALMPASVPAAAGVLRVTGTIPPAAAPLELFSPWLGYQAGAAPPGSYHFHDAWHTIDHLLLGPGLFDEVGLSYAVGAGFAVIHDGLLDAAGTPRAFDRGPPPSGVSDHLPLRLELTLHSHVDPGPTASAQRSPPLATCCRVSTRSTRLPGTPALPRPRPGQLGTELEHACGARQRFLGSLAGCAIPLRRLAEPRDGQRDQARSRLAQYPFSAFDSGEPLLHAMVPERRSERQRCVRVRPGRGHLSI